MRIKSTWGHTLYESQSETAREALQEAVQHGVSLISADLSGLDLRGAELAGRIWNALTCGLHC